MSPRTPAERRLLLSVLGAALLAALGGGPATGAVPAASNFALLPEHYDASLRATESYFVAVAEPGTTFRNAVRVRNVGTRTGTAYLYAVDATTGRTSGAVYLDGTKPRRGVGGWVTLGAKSVTLLPGTSRVVPVTVRVPAGVRPGDHLGGIVAENAAVTGSRGKGALQIRVRHLTIAAVEVQVPGKTAAGVSIAGVRPGGEHGYQYLYVNLKSTGALATKPTGRVLIVDSDGKRVAEQQFRMDTFLPRTRIDYPVLLTKRALDPGDYRATVELTYAASALGYRREAGEAQTISRSFSFSVTSSQYQSVFRGTKALQQHRQSTSGSSGSTILLVLSGALAALVVGAVGLALAVRRWTCR